MLHIQHFLLFAMCYTRAYSTPYNKQNFNGIRAGSFYNRVSGPQNDQNFEGWTGDDFFNDRVPVGVPNPHNVQTFRNAHVGGTFHNDVPRTGNVQDFTGLKAEGGFIDVNRNGATQNEQNLNNQRENDHQNTQTFRNAQIGGKFYNDVPRRGNVQDFTGLNAGGGFIDVNRNGPTQNEQSPRNQNDDYFNRQNFEDAKIGGDFYNVVRSGAVRDAPHVNYQYVRSTF